MPSPIDLEPGCRIPPSVDRPDGSQEPSLVVRAISDGAVWGTNLDRPHLRHRRRRYSVPTTDSWRSRRISGGEFLRCIETSKNNVGH